ncbi:hypothetical protein SCHPADRAFT_832216 [Schizopora paradoxa]|uniref:Cupredoxin n=1 Tax=Schizopora paradoxa TaxID=27342 RepID=A0A0H2RMI2_9AGAM|nr:hypothetical protein SCHPADRAFT_832216 [Schizopora paradoxa]
MFYNKRSAALALAVASLAAIPAEGKNISVTVGGPGGVVAFSPNQVTADVGDLILFEFQQKNHTATQSSFENPCVALPGGFNSGFIPVDATQTSNFPIGVLTVNTTDPYWVFCEQTGHCQQGMVFAINPGNQFAAFQAAATGNSSTTAATATASATGAVTVTATVTVDNGGQTLTTTYGSYPGSAEPTSGTSQDHQVVVGGNGIIAFNPANITAQPGDTITFQFQVKNHTVTQSNFAQPCRKLSDTSTTGQVGFNSGFMPVAANATTFPTFTIQVNDTAPIWAYCAQTGHCGQGMVFSANAVESGPNNFEAFKALAIQQNGTSSNSSSTTSAAMSVNVNRGAGVALSIVAMFFGFML